MSEIKISQLPVSAPLTGPELVPIVQDGVTVQTTAQSIANLGNSVIPIGGATGEAGATDATTSSAGRTGRTLGGRPRRGFSWEGDVASTVSAIVLRRYFRF